VKHFVSKMGCAICLEKGQCPVDVSLVVWEVIITNSEVYHTGIEEGMASLMITIKVSQGDWFDLGLFW